MLDPAPGYLDCPECGTSVAPLALEQHRCDDRHRHDHVKRVAGPELSARETALRFFHETPRPQFSEH
jgi:hypothetical protein